MGWTKAPLYFCLRTAPLSDRMQNLSGVHVKCDVSDRMQQNRQRTMISSIHIDEIIVR